jgi:protein-S-isoprenylcysteine O-methyltransferase Ste14
MRLLTLAYGVLCYLIFFATFLYLIAFVGGEAAAFAGAPKTVDWGEPAAVFAPPALQNVLLLLLFGASHSVMARPGFKAWWTKIVPPAAERSTYVLVASLALIVLFAYWRPMPNVVWEMTGAWAALATILFWAGFGIVLLTTFLINHFDLFGLKQVWEHYRGAAESHDPFKTPALYGVTRHPLYLGFVIAFWAGPVMTVGHLLLAAVLTIYIFIAIGYEERDLVARFGDDYRRYMERVPMLLPIGRRKG